VAGFAAGADLDSLLPQGGDAADPSRDNFHQALAAGTCSRLELRLLRRDGKPLPVRANLVTIAQQRLWTLQDLSAIDALAEHAADQAEWLDAAQEFGHLGVWRRDIATGQGRWGRRAFDIWGLPPGTSAPDTETVLARVHPDDRASVSPIDSMTRPGRQERRYRIVRPDGSVRSLHTQWEVKSSADGRPHHLVGVMIDATDAHVDPAGHLPGEAGRQTDLAVDLARVGIWRHDLQTERVRFNARGGSVFGIEARAEGVPIEELHARVHTDDLSGFIESTRQALRSTAPVDLEARCRSADGDWHFLLLRQVVERSQSGEPLALLGVALDVTDRVARARRAEELAQRHEAALRAARIGVWTTTVGSDAVEWNAPMHELFEQVGAGSPPSWDAWLTTGVHPDDRDRVHAAVAGSFDRDGHAFEIEFRSPRSDGGMRWIELRGDHERNGIGPRRLFGVAFDVSQRHAVIDALNRDDNGSLHAEPPAPPSGPATPQVDPSSATSVTGDAEHESRLKSQFMSRMSHELRTPLNAVLGFTQLLQMEAADAGRSADLGKLKHIRNAGEHLLGLINDVLDLTDLESGRMHLDLRVVALADIVTEALRRVEPFARQRQLRLVAGRLEGHAHADPARLRQVLNQLLRTAIKATRPGSEVAVESAVIASQVRLRLRDSGRDLGSEQLARLFEPFNRFVGDRGEGSGVGLTVVKALVQRMGGTINASSRSGQGTLFELTLPSQPDDKALDPRRQASPARRAGRLLYIEDNGVNVLLVEQMVASLPGLQIVSEATGAEGVARARELLPDLILVDMQLPDFDGFEVLKRLRAEPDTAGITCIALSANALPEDIAHGLDAGFADYWTKPIDFKAFTVALERLFPLRYAPD
jgi:signal transduction histidine kinase/PAS domain-containing protein/CheY-like chemotaxis protein